ncbi:MAG: 30S ribosomal protein S17 [Nitrospinales bacterium]
MTGKVVSDKMNKTIVVLVERKFSHKKFKKVVKRTKRYKCHDEENTCAVGDIVTMKEVRPLSKDKRWSLVTVDKRINSDQDGKQ